MARTDLRWVVDDVVKATARYLHLLAPILVSRTENLVNGNVIVIVNGYVVVIPEQWIRDLEEAAPKDVERYYQRMAHEIVLPQVLPHGY